MPGKQLKLMCLLWPDDQPDQHSVEIKIDNDETVAALKECIRGTHPNSLAHVDARDLVLWKCSGFPDDDGLKQSLETIRFDGSDGRVVLLQKARQRISQLFEQVDLSKEPIHILVKVHEPEHQIPLAPLPNFSNMREERQKFEAGFRGKAPSSQGLPSAFSKLQQKPNEKIFWSRPPTADASIPVTLLHPIFREFVDNCKNHRPVKEDNGLVLELMAAMSDFFSGENARAAEFRAILTRHAIPVETATIRSKGRDFRTEGSIAVDGHLVVVFELRDEIGSTGTEPYAQIILYYTHSTLVQAQEFSKFSFPCLLIIAFGPQISFSGAVWTTRPHFQVLTPTLPLFCHSTDTEMRESLARHFGAFRAAIRSLEKCYNTLKDPALLESLDPQFPDPRSYKSRQTSAIVHLKYLRQIDAEKLLFIGETDDRERICIKFVRRYSPETHEKCAQMGIAPKLRGFEEIGGGWKMVIMDTLDEGYTIFDKTLLPADARTQISERLVELHQANFVHGDVRDVNIMVRKDGKLWFMLVDFDWSGIIGQARYPINVNNVDVWRPDGASDGMLIKSDHDMAMLERLFV